MQMYCSKCGAQNPDDAKMCHACGSGLIQSTKAPGLVAKTSGMAVVALVLGILSIFTCGITTIPAIILGIVSLVKIERSGGSLSGTGFAIAGIVVPTALLPLLALLIGILMPALARVRHIAFRMTCGNNMAGLGKVMLIYAGDYDEKFPTPSNWCDLLNEYTEMKPRSFRCIGGPIGRCNYAMNVNIEKLGTSSPPDMVLLFETPPGWNQAGGPEILTTENHQGEGCNVLFIDTHVEFVTEHALKNLRWKPD
jgi:prepilin-type processing-associated H-X9-DG protein